MSAILLIRESKQPVDCPDWDYETHPNWQTVLPQRTSETLIGLVDGTIDTRQSALDCRPVHRRLFEGLTPVGHDYFAGHYRGEPFRCLQHYEVGVPGDPRVGTPPHAVDYRLRQWKASVQSAVDALDTDRTLSRQDRLRYLIALACSTFELFLR